jgi:arginine decarboxylase
MVWNSEAARQQYNISGWSAGYFDVGDAGHLLAVPQGRPGTPTVDLHTLAHAVRDAGLSWPVLLRFTDILHEQVDRLCAAFEAAIKAADYPAGYTAIYPIKVNQQHHVVEAIVQHGGARVGLEAGSKAELIAVIGIAPGGSRIICNGYKDAGYIRLALLAQRLGHDITLVIEKQSELALVAGIAASLALRPNLGVRIRLSAATSGNWQNSGGDRAKFGFTAAGILALIEELQQRALDDCVCLLHCHPGSQISSLATLQTSLQEVARCLLHCHPGSQISSLATLQTSLQEVARTWVSLKQAGLPVTAVNVGGGLGVDYEGLSAAKDCSIDYDMAAYAETVVGSFAQVCREQQLAAPALLSESGRALTAHHAVLVTDVIDSERVLVDFDPPASSLTTAATQLHEALNDCQPDTACALYAQANTLLAQPACPG